MSPTYRQARLAKKREMAARRRAREQLQELKGQGLTVYEGEVVSLDEARKCGGRAGGEHGI